MTFRTASSNCRAAAGVSSGNSSETGVSAGTGTITDVSAGAVTAGGASLVYTAPAPAP